MFLLRLIYLSGTKVENENSAKSDVKQKKEIISGETTNKDTVNQIRNVTQEKKTKPEAQIETKTNNEVMINSFSQLLDICFSKKEMKLKYELEKNVNLVKFENQRIEISFNDNLDKNFVKDLSSKLFEWTNQRWIISFSKNKGEMSVKDKERVNQLQLIENAKETDLYKRMVNFFPDAELIDIKPLQTDDDND